MVNIAGQLEAEALRILREIPGLDVAIEKTPRKPGVDAIVRFTGKQTPVAVEFKRRVNAATAWDLVQTAKARRRTPLLIVAGETTAEARGILETHRIAIVDGLGNAHIELPGLLFHLEGRGRVRGVGATPARTRLRGKAGIVAQALLLRLERAWQIKDLADYTKVSAALVHRILTRLENEKIVAAEGAGPKRLRRVLNRTALLDLWAEESVERTTRTLAYRLSQTPTQLINDVAGNLGRGGVDYALTGAAAASLVAPFTTAIPIIHAWVEAKAAPSELCETAGADPVTEGPNVVFLQGKDNAPLAFREEVKRVWVANRFRVYVDLRQDPRRGREQAEHLRREVIGF
ncbi:MAG: hypothetical protein HY700_02000 [Gemmatimonadetes bacterium]|nr:hypothetical protein [Gemmatimonadota bacterium]